MLASAIESKKNIKISSHTETELLKHLSRHLDSLFNNLDKLKTDVFVKDDFGTTLDEAKYCHDILLGDMAKMRHDIDALERLVGNNDWPYPTYTDLIFRV